MPLDEYYSHSPAWARLDCESRSWPALVLSLRLALPVRQIADFVLAVRATRPLSSHWANTHAVDRALKPVEWLLANQDVDQRWCLIHATQMIETETTMLADSGAVVGLCPMTESNLGDGIFDGRRYADHAGRFAIGSDSNIRISLSEELRTLEYSQRLRDKARAVLAEPSISNGRLLFDAVTKGGAQSLQRNSGVIEAGKLADLVALDNSSPNTLAVTEDGLLDAWIFAGNDQWVTDVWSAGRHVVQDSRHVNHDRISRCYSNTMKQLAAKL